jgi:hypothetical protein
LRRRVVRRHDLPINTIGSPIEQIRLVVLAGHARSSGQGLLDQLVAGCTSSHNDDPVHQSPRNSPHHWRRLFSAVGLAIVAGLFVTSTAGAEARRRAYLPTLTGVTVVDLNNPAAVMPAYTSPTPVVLAFTRDAQRMYGITQSGTPPRMTVWWTTS